MNKCTVKEWEEWADTIIVGKWHTIMLEAFCTQAVKDRKRLDELEEALIQAGKLAEDEGWDKRFPLTYNKMVEAFEHD